MSEQPTTTPKRGMRFVPALAAVLLIGLALGASQLFAPSANTAQQPDDKPLAQATKAVTAAKKFLAALDDAQRGKAVLEFNSAKKSAWSNLPVDFVPRNGVRMGDLTKPQREAALELLAAVLSKEGYQKTIDIMDADQQLAEGKGGGGKGPKDGKGKDDKGKDDKGDKGKDDKGDKGKDGKGKGKGGNPKFGNDHYYMAIFGEPSLTKPWFVQFGGHHLGLNVTIVEKSFVLTPSHTGAQPTNFTRDGKTIRPLGPENDKAFELVNSLTEKQRAMAILQQKAGNLVLGPGQDGKKIEPKGIKGSELTEAQQAKLLEVIGAWVNIVPTDSASARMAEIKANLADTYFAWSGPTAAGSVVYYRIQGPTLVIEYADQGGTNHVHTIIRDPSNDYAQKLTKRE